jgi:crotonobetainyl-CoA:carnitine CoA-transferase CaiB-like acyl-CoA transferase
MEGIRVVEVAEYAMAPSAAAVLADWGADVIKVERVEGGDVIRGASAWGIAPEPGAFSFLWEPFNRGKRSIGVDVSKPEGRDVVLQLVRDADIFITNFLPAARRKLGLDVDDLRAINPRLIYARGSAHGPKGPQAELGGFDSTAFWNRSGLGMAAMPHGTEDLVTLPGPAVGDIQTGLTLAAGITAALFHRERTGEALTVDVSLLACGMWVMQSSLVATNIHGLKELPHANRFTAANPAHNTYRTKDGRFLSLGMMRSDANWAGLCRVIDRPDLIDDPRYSDFYARERNNLECIQELNAVFLERTLDEWSEVLARQEGPWTRVNVVSELNDDAQAWANGYLQRVDYRDGRELTLVPSPVQFNEAAPTLKPAPPHAIHTEEILLEMGLGWDRIIELKDLGAVT